MSSLLAHDLIDLLVVLLWWIHQISFCIDLIYSGELADEHIIGLLELLLRLECLVFLPGFVGDAHLALLLEESQHSAT